MSALAPTTATPKFSLAPKTLDEAFRFADIVSKSSLVPKEYQNNAGNCLVAIQWGAELGLAPLQSMQNIAVINGRPSVYGDAMLSLVKGSGLLVSIREDVTDTVATCYIQRKGEQEVSRSFSVDDAKRASLWGKSGPWSQYPKRMLQMRARAWALRDVFPDVLKGVYIAEEAQDIPAEKDMGQAKVVTPAATSPGSSKADKVLNKIKAIQLQDVLNCINDAKTLDELAIAAEKAKKLQSEEDKKTARAVYLAKKKQLVKAVTVSEDVKEVADPETGEMHMTFAQVMEHMKKATTPEDFDILQDMIQLVEQEEQREELMKTWNIMRSQKIK